MKIFQFGIDIDKENKVAKCCLGCNKEDFDPEAFEMIKTLVEDVSKLITMAYLHKVVKFDSSIIEVEKVDA